jgi:acyl dehydratase
MSAKYRYEDFNVGDVAESERYRVDPQSALDFARAYDPQPFHLDAEAAQNSFFKRLVISGWQTAAITMRLLVGMRSDDSFGIIGTGIDELRWTAPVLPGDELRVRSEVIEKRPWPGGKPRGIVRFRNETINQDDVVVMSHIANTIVPASTTSS